MTISKVTTMRFTTDDLVLLSALKDKLGVISQTEVVRMALRALAERQELKSRKKQ